MTVYQSRSVCLECGADMETGTKGYSRHFCSQACTTAYKIKSAKQERLARALPLTL